MKKLIALILSLAFALVLVGCSAKDTAIGKPVFETENITRVTFYSSSPNSAETEVPSEYLAEITEWLGTFVAGKKAEDVLPPGADSLFVRIEYSDGTIIENSMSTTIVDGITYLINYDKEPQCYFDLFTATVYSPTESSMNGGISYVQVIEENSDTEESSYRVGADLSGTAFSSISQMLEDKIKQEWETHDGMTKEALMLSSRVWGLVYFETDTWNEFEEAIGLTVKNPLESLSWLNKTGNIGMESADPSTPIKHIEVTADTVADRKLNEIRVTSGYNTESVRITLTATLSASEETYTTGCAYNGYATYEQHTAMTGSGIPVLIVITDGMNNTGYYNGDYYDPTAYWVKDNVFYTLRVFGDSTDKEEIQAALDRILAEI